MAEQSSAGSTEPDEFRRCCERFQFLVKHEDEFTNRQGYAFCSLCHLKVKWRDEDSVRDHLLTPRHTRAQVKIEQRLEEFHWLELAQGVPRCILCCSPVPWKNLQKLRDHEDSSVHISAGGGLAESSEPGDSGVKMEEDEVDHRHKMLITNEDIGFYFTEELKHLRHGVPGTVRIKCDDGEMVAHLEVFLLSTLLFSRLEGLTEDYTILCPEAKATDVQLALDMMYFGVAYPTSQHQRDSVLKCLTDLNFVGVLTEDGTSVTKGSLEAIKMEQSREWSLEKELISPRLKVLKSRKERRVFSRPSDLTLAIRLRQFPDLERVGSDLHCKHCREKVDWLERRRINQHFKTTKHIRAKTAALQEMDEKSEDEDDWIVEDDHEDDEEEEGNISDEAEFRRGRRPGPSLPRISLEARIQQFPDLAEFEGEVICRVCKTVLDWTKRSRISEHMRSQKHIRSSRSNTEPVQLEHLTEADRIKIHAQAQRVKRSMKNKDTGESSEDEYEDDTDVPFQEKLVQRMLEFPWMKKLPKVDEVRCVFCKCPVNWERKSHILDHIKSKKHLSAVDQKKCRYPDVIKRMAEIMPKYSDESEKPNNGDRLAYRIHLRQGTPAIQKLWGAALLIGTMTTQISMCYICFKLFLSQQELMLHSQTEHKDIPNKSIHSPLYNKETKEFFCNGCNKFTEAKKSLMCFLVHNLICTKQFYTSSLPLKCFKCEQRFTQYKNFREHVESAHEDLLPERLMCTDCPQTYLTNEELKRHFNQVHTEHVFSCSQCPNTFKNKNSLKEHVVKHHIGVKNFSCDTCGKEFYGKQNLRMHMRIHVAPENRPHACDLCGMRFIERKHLLNHQATHTNDRPHKCHLCDSRFKVRDWLSNHYIKQHGISIKDVESKFKHLSRPGGGGAGGAAVVSATQYYHH